MSVASAIIGVDMISVTAFATIVAIVFVALAAAILYWAHKQPKGEE